MFRAALLIFSLFMLSIPDVYASSLSYPSHDITIEFDLKAHTFKAVDRLKIDRAKKKELTVSIHRNIAVTSVKSPDAGELPFSVKDEGKDKKRLMISLPLSAKGEMEIAMEYHGRFGEFPGEIRFSREFLSDRPAAYIGEEIVLLDGAACWYLCTGGNASFRVTAVTPSGYEAVMEGTKSLRTEKEGTAITTWDFPDPAPGIYLIAGRYVVTEERYNDIDLYTYFFPEDQNLSGAYIEHAKRYLENYERLFGRYPFRKFAVVENVLPTGYGMPSYTLLGQTVLRLPFIVKTSLGHEIAHNWWGNAVYPEYESGNWSEGLTTYMADHLYEEMEGRGAQYRNQLLRDYTNYVEPAKDYPVTKFKSRVGPADRAIGYGKGAYVFHMLRVMLGDEVFYRGLKEVVDRRSFKTTSWRDFRDAFEKVSGRDLKWFFRQWVEGDGAPVIRLGDVQLKGHEKGYTIRAGILQKGRPYEIYLPVLVETEEGPLLTYHWIKRQSNTLEIEVPARPKSIAIDPNYDVFRRLNPEEMPATIGKFLGAKDRFAILPSKEERKMLDSYSKAASGMDVTTTKMDKDVKKKDLDRNFFYALNEAGEDVLRDQLISKLPPDIKIGGETISINGKVYDKKGAVLVVSIANPFKPGSVILIFSGDNPEYITSVGEKVIHYGKYSYLLFVKGENVEKGTWETGKIGKAF